MRYCTESIGTAGQEKEVRRVPRNCIQYDFNLTYRYEHDMEFESIQVRADIEKHYIVTNYAHSVMPVPKSLSHQRYHRRSDAWPCEKCEKKFSNYKELHRHKQKTHAY